MFWIQKIIIFIFCVFKVLQCIPGFVQGNIYYHGTYLHCYVSTLYIAAIDIQVFFFTKLTFHLQ